MKRIAITIILAAMLPVAVPANAAETELPPAPDATQNFVALKPSVIVNADVVKLGDIFQGVGKYAERTIAYAPRPGGRAVFDARWLSRVAAAFKLNWRPASRAETVVVERASQVVTKTDIEDLLQQQWEAQGGDTMSRTQLSNRAFRLHLPMTGDLGAENLLSVEQMIVDQASGRFSAVLAWGTGNDERVRLAGRVERMTEVPVLSDRLQRGEVISEKDIEWQTLPLARLPRGAITEPGDIIGMATKRTLHPGKPVTTSDVQRPLLVNRGETVTMVLTTPEMRLTAKGRALENGSRGDTVRISNLQTNTVVDAIVTGPGQARVETAVNLAMR